MASSSDDCHATALTPKTLNEACANVVDTSEQQAVHDSDEACYALLARAVGG